MFTDAIAYAVGLANDLAGVDIVYVHDNHRLNLRATPGSTRFEVSDGAGGVRVVHTDRDFLLPAAKLVVHGKTVLPLRGHVIEEHVAGIPMRTYEVKAPDGEQPYRLDPTRTMLRIHCQDITPDD